jgi:heparanase 1
MKLAQYEDDLRDAKNLLAQEDPGTLLTGFSSAFWPSLGEVIHPMLTHSRAANDALDIVSWHYYPTQSDRYRILDLRPANEKTVISTKTLDEFRKFSSELKAYKDRYFPSAQLWLGETGQAQFGGQRGLSDRFISGLWWLDELGIAAQTGQQVVVRQTLVGSDYGMLAQDTLDPNPDYWNSVIWKKLMGRQVLEVEVPEHPDTLRVYAHCTSPSAAEYQPGAITILALNVDPVRTQTFSLGLTNTTGASVYGFSSPDPLSTRIDLNGAELALGRNDSVPELQGQLISSVAQSLTPRTYAFYVLPNANAPACGAYSPL